MAEGVITEAEALELADLYNQGVLFDLPLRPEQVRQDTGREELIAALALLLLFTGRSERDLRFFSIPTKRAISQTLLAQYVEQSSRLTTQLHARNITTAEWQNGMMTAIREHLEQQVNLGTGGRAGLWGRSRIQFMNELLEEQAAFLQRFADQHALRLGTEQPFSLPQLLNRSRQYGGFAIGEFERSAELQAVDDGDIEDGIVMRYIARDDRGTCSPCLSSQGYYLPGEGPYPGMVCLGRDRCRCYRTPEYNPEMFERLSGRTIARSL